MHFVVYHDYACWTTSWKGKRHYDPGARRTAKSFHLSVDWKSIPEKYHVHYEKWLRFYLDFCRKYRHPAEASESLLHFIQKLREKRRKTYQLKQAGQAVAIYYEITRKRGICDNGDRKQISETSGEHRNKRQKTSLKADPPFDREYGGIEKQVFAGHGCAGSESGKKFCKRSVV